MLPRQSGATCDAPGCTAPARFVAEGRDFDGTAFKDAVCASCGGYLVEASSELWGPEWTTRLTPIGATA